MSDFNPLERELNTPEKLHEFAARYNWDDGLEVPRWIVNHPLCDRGTALMMYWLAGPRYYCQYATRDDVPHSGWNLQHYDLLREIEEKYLNGFYQHQTILFNPRHDLLNGMEGYDWTQDYADKPLRKELPVEMFEPSIPDVQWERAGKPIKPTERIDYDEWFSTLSDEESGKDCA